MPYAVNKAFAIELYIKCMLCWRKAKPSGRTIWPTCGSVFRTIAKARIDRHFQALVASSPKRDRSDSGFDPHDIQSVLAHQARAFELFRYGYEPGGKELNITTAPLDVGIRRVILEMKPERTRHTADVPK